MVGEELGQSEGAATSEYCWLVDPHDGTAAFLRGFRGSTVSIGLLRHNQPVLGVVYAPLYPNDRGDLISGGPGLGLRRAGKPWSTPGRSGPLSASDLIAISQDADLRAEGNIKALAPARYLAMPSIAYRLALTATGDTRAGVSLVFLSAHDVGAGHALLLAGGKNLIAWERGPATTVAYSPHIRAVPVVAGDPEAVDELRTRESGAILATPKNPPLSPLPASRRWRERGLSLDRAQGCLLGQLAGDDLGSLVECKSDSLIAAAYPEGPNELADGGTWHTLAGQPTDDSEMALALARQLLADGGFVAPNVLKAYRAWLASPPFDIGATTARGLQGRPNEESQANGSLMRCSPLGVAFSPEDLATIAKADSALTHPNALCTECCRIFTQTISRGIAGQSVSEAIAAALDDCQGEVKELLESALHAPPKEYQHQMGWVKIAFVNAFYLLAQERPLAEALTWTVRQGGDTDTNAAIAGALLGAFQGLEAIPSQWRLSVLSCRPAKANPAAQQPRPMDYWPVDALNLAELLLELR